MGFRKTCVDVIGIYHIYLIIGTKSFQLLQDVDICKASKIQYVLCSFEMQWLSRKIISLRRRR
jgi:hypothetical protein